MNKAMAVLLTTAVLAAHSASAGAASPVGRSKPAMNIASGQSGTVIAALNYKNPDQLLIVIKRAGAQAVVLKLFGSGEGPEWEYVLGQIATGQEVWLQVAVALSPGADGAAGEELTTAEASALAVVPIRVLSMFGVEGVCGNVEGVGPTYADAKAALDRQRKAVAAIREPEYQAARAACLKEIDASYAPLKHAFGVR